MFLTTTWLTLLSGRQVVLYKCSQSGLILRPPIKKEGENDFRANNSLCDINLEFYFLLILIFIIIL